MSTRSCIGVRINGVDKLSYNMHDGYPEGVGQNLLNEFLEAADADGLSVAIYNWRTMATNLRLVTEQNPPSAEDIVRWSEFEDTSVGLSSDKWYRLLRKQQGSIIKRLAAGVMMENPNFITSGLFCEWAYIFNFDTEVFEVYEGLQVKPHQRGRYASAAVESGYYPCALLASIPFAALIVGEGLLPSMLDLPVEA